MPLNGPIDGARRRFWYSEPYLTFGEVRLRCVGDGEILRIACDHRGLTHYGGAHFFHEFLQVLQQFAWLAENLVELRTGDPVST